MVVRLLCDSLIWAQNPKSVSLMSPRCESRILSDLMSLWITFFECKCCNPNRTYAWLAADDDEDAVQLTSRHTAAI